MRARYVFKKCSYENKWKQMKTIWKRYVSKFSLQYMWLHGLSGTGVWPEICLYSSISFLIGEKNAETAFFQWKWWHVHFILFVLQVPTSPKWGKEGELISGKVRKKALAGGLPYLTWQMHNKCRSCRRIRAPSKRGKEIYLRRHRGKIGLIKSNPSVLMRI